MILIVANNDANHDRDVNDNDVDDYGVDAN